ncbi:MAG: cysteine desulfurase [Bacilli bacterium]|nr:cysteine desulfurase [Bacilli bacterium]
MNREDFPILENNPNLVYFDNGATTLKPKCLSDATTEYYEKYSANAHRGDYGISLKVDMAFEGVREAVAKFINAETNEIIFTSGSTESLNLVAFGYFKNRLNSNDEVLISYAEHASNVLPWFRIQSETGCKVNFIPLDDTEHITLENVKKSITENTKVISLAHITNVIGDIRPIKEIVEYAHSKNILVVVDGAQSVPHIKTDVKDLDVDFLAFSAHKMMGPTGVGVLYGKYDLLKGMVPLMYGGGMNEKFDSPDCVELKDVPTRFEAGTPNIAGVIGFGAVLKYINNIGIENIYKHEVELKNYMIDKLKDIPHVNIISNSDSGIVTFNVEGIFPQDVAVFLDKYNICVRAGNHCAKILKNETKVNNTVRASLYMYNTQKEVDKFVDLLRDKDKIIREMI